MIHHHKIKVYEENEPWLLIAQLHKFTIISTTPTLIRALKHYVKQIINNKYIYMGSGN